VTSPSRTPDAKAAEWGVVDQVNRVERRVLVRRRDGGTCIWCGRVFDPLVTPTVEHVVPRVKGGPSWLENEVAACRRCNGERGHRGAVEWLDECRRRGWAPDAARLDRVLSDLAAAIEGRGGQRRARVQVASQRRRLRRLTAVS
jgi:hypothetical protein